MSDRKYPPDFYAALNRDPMGDALTVKQINAVLDTAGRLLVAAELERLVDETDWAWAVGGSLQRRAAELRGGV